MHFSLCKKHHSQNEMTFINTVTAFPVWPSANQLETKLVLGKKKKKEMHFQHELINEESLCSMCAESHSLVTKNILAKKTKQNAFGYKILYVIKTTN